jgi:hypothetical protein
MVATIRILNLRFSQRASFLLTSFIVLFLGNNDYSFQNNFSLLLLCIFNLL